MTSHPSQDVSALIRSQRPWWEIATAIRAVRDEKRWSSTHKNFGNWLKEVSRESGRSAAQLRRYLTTLDFAEKLVAENKIENLEAAIGIPEVTLDSLARLSRLSVGSFGALLARAQRGQLSYRDALRELSKASQDHPDRLGAREAARRLPAQFEKACEAAIKRNPHLLSKDHQLLVRPPRLPFHISADALLPAVDWAWCDGCEFIYVEAKQLQKNGPKRTIEQISWSARFFRRYWSWVPNRELADMVVSLVKSGGLANVGIVEFDTEKRGGPIIRREISESLRTESSTQHLLTALSRERKKTSPSWQETTLVNRD